MSEDKTGAPPLAEARWLWRRLYVFASTAAAWLGLDAILGRAPVEAAPQLAQALMMLLALTLVLYLVAPTAQQIIAAIVALKSGQAR